MDSNQVITEFIYFHLPQDVKPEDSGNSKGRELLDLFQETKHQKGYSWSAWGRADEDNNSVMWVIEWLEDGATFSTSQLEGFACSSPALIKLRTNLTPSLSSVGGITSAPTMDITTFPFTAGVTEEQDAVVRNALTRMKEGVLTELPDEVRPPYWLMSTWDSRPIVSHPESPTGKSQLSIVVVGWQSTAQHYEIWKLTDFRSEYIAPVKAHMLPYPEGIGMKHVQFKMT